MSKQKDFKTLFGCDDSDEENIQDKFSNTGGVGIKRNVTETDDNSKQKHKSRLENNTTASQKLEQLEGKRVRSSAPEHKKRLKTEYIEEKDKKRTQEVINSIKYDSETIRSSNVKARQSEDSKEKVKLKKTEIGGLVVKLLTPAYIEKRFESRDTFKMLARNISHALHDKGKISWVWHIFLGIFRIF